MDNGFYEYFFTGLGKERRFPSPNLAPHTIVIMREKGFLTLAGEGGDAEVFLVARDNTDV